MTDKVCRHSKSQTAVDRLCRAVRVLCTAGLYRAAGEASQAADHVVGNKVQSIPVPAA